MARRPEDIGSLVAKCETGDPKAQPEYIHTSAV